MTSRTMHDAMDGLATYALDAPYAEGMRRHTFATTHWSVVKLAADSTSQAGPDALAELCQAYWHPLYVFIRHKRNDPHSAQDLTQAFLADFDPFWSRPWKTSCTTSSVDFRRKSVAVEGIPFRWTPSISVR